MNNRCTGFGWVHALAAGVVMACGAPTKDADRAKSAFGGHEQIAARMASVCHYLASRDEEPNLQGLAFSELSCRQGGEQGLAPLDSESFRFMEVQTDVQPLDFKSNSANIMLLSAHSSGLIDRPVLGLIDTALPKLKELSDRVTDQESAEGAAAAGEKFELETIEEAKFDAASGVLTVKVRIISKSDDNGLTDVNNDYQVVAQLVNSEYIVASVTSISDQEFTNSFVHGGKIVVMLIPHGDGILFYSPFSIRLHDLGVRKTTTNEFYPILSRLYTDLIEVLNQ